MEDVAMMDVKSMDFLNYTNPNNVTNQKKDAFPETMEMTNVSDTSPDLNETDQGLDFDEYTGGPIEKSVVDFISKKSLTDNCNHRGQGQNEGIQFVSNQVSEGEKVEMAPNQEPHMNDFGKDCVIPDILASEEMKALVKSIISEERFSAHRVIFLSTPESKVLHNDTLFLVSAKCLENLKSVDDLVPKGLDTSKAVTNQIGITGVSSDNNKNTNVNSDIGDINHQLFAVEKDGIDVSCDISSDLDDNDLDMAETGETDETPVVGQYVKPKLNQKHTCEHLLGKKHCSLGSNDQAFKSNGDLRDLRKSNSISECQNHNNPLNLSINSDCLASVMYRESFGTMNMQERLNKVANIAEDMALDLNGVKKWKCRFCEKCYTSKHNLIIHILDHLNIRPHCCPECGKLFKQVSHLQTHMRTHSKARPYGCDVCGKRFNQNAHLIRHSMIHKSEGKPYQCERCSRGFVYPSDLKMHLQRHDIRDRKVAEEGSQPTDNPASSVVDDRKCQECGKVFPFPSLLKEHMFKHSGERPYMCRECGMEFVKPHHLRTHEFTHSGEKPHKCSVCHRGFALKSNMERHMVVHFPKRIFKCDECGKSFTQKQVLQAHLITHSDQKPYDCEICGKQFSRLHNLQGHMALHNLNKKYNCFCGRSFTLKGNLNRHQKDVHKMSKFTKTSEYSAEEAARVLNLMSSKVGT